MKKIKVLHIVQSPGGVERYLRSLLKYTNDNAIENYLICSNDYLKSEYYDLVSGFENVHMMRSISLKDDFRAIFEVRRMIKKYKPDIIYLHSSKAGAIGRIANIGEKNKCVYNPHGWAFNMGHSHIKKKLYMLIERILSPLCDKIICISNSEKKSAVVNKICKDDKIQVILNGIDFEEYSKEEDNIENELPNGVFVIGCVGRLTEQKAPEVFIEMAEVVKRKIPNAFFVMVGDGEERMRIENLIDEKGLTDCVKITGWVQNPYVYIKKFDVAMLLSRWEGFGLVLPEYMLAGKPIVATKVDAISEIVENEYTGLLINKDAWEEAANCVFRLYKDRNLKKYLVKNEVNDVKEKYNVKRVAYEHELLYKNIMR